MPLESTLDLSGFQCGEESLDYWLQRKAKSNQVSGASRTFVTFSKADELAGFYSLAAGSISRATAPKQVQRNSPDPIPIYILGRLAVDLKFQGMGTGSSLLQHAILQAGAGLRFIGASALLVHALNDSASQFYQKFGFTQSEFDSRTLFMPTAILSEFVRRFE